VLFHISELVVWVGGICTHQWSFDGTTWPQSGHKFPRCLLECKRILAKSL